MSVSSVYVPDLEKHLLGYGDINGTPDAFVAVFSPDLSTIEIFIARGYVNDMMALYTSAKDGELFEEMEALRAAAKNAFKGELPNQ